LLEESISNESLKNALSINYQFSGNHSQPTGKYGLYKVDIINQTSPVPKKMRMLFLTEKTLFLDNETLYDQKSTLF
jgi:hypothetical protein